MATRVVAGRTRATPLLKPHHQAHALAVQSQGAGRHRVPRRIVDVYGQSATVARRRSQNDVGPEEFLARLQRQAIGQPKLRRPRKVGLAPGDIPAPFLRRSRQRRPRAGAGNADDIGAREKPADSEFAAVIGDRAPHSRETQPAVDALWPPDGNLRGENRFSRVVQNASGDGRRPPQTDVQAVDHPSVGEVELNRAFDVVGAEPSPDIAGLGHGERVARGRKTCELESTAGVRENWIDAQPAVRSVDADARASQRQPALIGDHAPADCAESARAGWWGVARRPPLFGRQKRGGQKAQRENPEGAHLRWNVSVSAAGDQLSGQVRSWKPEPTTDR
jgi:hypothetical protein